MSSTLSITLSILFLVLITSFVPGPPGRALAVNQRRSTATKPGRTHLAAVESRCFRGDLNSIALKIPLVAYPRKAAKQGIGGKVTIKVFVNEKGMVYYALAIDGHRSLRQAALGSARGSRFAPFTQDGRPIKCAGHLVYTFNPPDL